MAASNLGEPVGLPLDRVDGRLKVTGKAPYAYEYATQGSALYGAIVTASIAKGRVAAVNVQDAQNAPGVRLVLTKDNAPPQHPFGPVDLPDRFARAMPALNNDDVPYFGFPVAFVVADTFEQAAAAAGIVHIRYGSAPGAYDLHAASATAINPGRIAAAIRPTVRSGISTKPSPTPRLKSTPPTPHPISIRRRWSRTRRWRCGMARS